MNRESEIIKLNVAAAPLAEVLTQAAAAERAVQDPDTCLPADAGGAPRLIVATDVITIAAGQSSDLPIAATGIPRIAVQGADQITTSLQATDGIFVLRIAAATGATPGDRTLIIADQGGREAARVTVRVTGTAKTGSGSGGSGKPAVLHGTKQACEATPGDLSKHGMTDCGDFELIATLLNVGNAKTPSDPAFERAIKDAFERAVEEKKIAAGEVPVVAKVTPKLRRVLANTAPPSEGAPAGPSHH